MVVLFRLERAAKLVVLESAAKPGEGAWQSTGMPSWTDRLRSRVWQI